MSDQEKVPNWRRKAALAREVECVRGLDELSRFPDIDDVLTGWVDGDGRRVKGGSILLFIGNSGRLTACINLPGNQQQFWTDIANVLSVIEELDERLREGQGSFKDKDSGKTQQKPPKQK